MLMNSAGIAQNVATAQFFHSTPYLVTKSSWCGLYEYLASLKVVSNRVGFYTKLGSRDEVNIWSRALHIVMPHFSIAPCPTPNN